MLNENLMLDSGIEGKSENEIKAEVKRAKLRALHLLTAILPNKP